MTAVHLGALVLALLMPQGAQDQETLKERRDQKLGEAWLKKAGWTTDYDKAREESKKSKKLIFAYFTRSYQP